MKVINSNHNAWLFREFPKHVIRDYIIPILIFTAEALGLRRQPIMPVVIIHIVMYNFTLPKQNPQGGAASYGYAIMMSMTR